MASHGRKVVEVQQLETVNPAVMGSKPEGSKPKTPRSTYRRLFHEMQFRATKNALMNYYEAGEMATKGKTFKLLANVLTGVTASGLLAGVVKNGKVLTNKAGLAGVIGLPICSVVKFFEQSTSELLPNYTQTAKKHISAAAGWVSLAETARAERMRIDVEPTRDVKEIAAAYNKLVEIKAKVAAEVLIPQDTHHYFSEHPEMVLEAVKRRGDAYKQFVQLEVAHLPSTAAADDDDEDPVDVIYF
ncbi:hypothetical protein ElyMa_001780500 [Elysia marginata]|uniref:SMODS and SLOG-associating 2TM effector domain-containing protein n=1 Tax=Elysia marginata TaxID=1093978 RepID=A0AAV4EDL8_9GAST|nr:hypothetical protein ElyMa_001780500 [Elysia marginata]